MSPDPHRTLIHVAAGAVEDAEGRILITRRPDHVHQGGLWEFPGGKLEPGEIATQCLARELREELDIEVLATEPLICVRHDYGDRRVLLDVHRVRGFSGRPRGLEGQPLRWQHPDAMVAAEFPAADGPIITALRLPDRMLITGPDPSRPAEFLRRLAAALDAGIRLVQLRARDLAPDAFVSLSLSVAQICADRGARLVLNGPLDPRRLPSDTGLHLTAARLMGLDRRPVEDARLVGASCHGARELDRAAALGLDYALLSPVARTGSHPGAAPLGWARFAALVRGVNLPVFALGGMDREDIPTARLHGGQGIAAITGLWPSAE